MDNPERESEYRRKLDELSCTVERLARHNLEIKDLILRYGDRQLKARLEKLMRKYSGAKVDRDVA